MATYKHLRSSTANKRPTTSIADGQLAINTNSTSAGLFFKDSTGATIIKVGPVHVGTTAPNATPGAGGSSGNSTGEVWLDTSLTPVGVKIWNGSAWVNGTPTGSTTVQGLLELATDVETQTGSDTARAVTPAGLQSKVSDSTSTTSSTTIASSTAVKSAYDLANAALPKSGGTVTGNLEIGTTGSLTFEGSTADGFETTLAVVDPTGDRTITLPNISGTVVTTGDTGTVTSTMLLDGTIVNADVNASAAIAGTKISPDFGSQTVQTTGVVSHALGTALAPTVTFTGDTNTGLFSPGSDQLALATGGTGRLFVDASGRVLAGTDTAIPQGTNVGFGRLQVLGTGSTQELLGRFSADASAAVFAFLKSRNATIGSHTIVNSSDTLGQINFQGSDGTDYLNAALIRAEVDGTPGANDMPGRLVFSTTADGASSPTERMRISNAGTTILTSAATTSPFIANISASEVARIDSSGRLLVGTSSNTNVGSTVGALVQTRLASGSINFAAVRESGGAIIALGRANGNAAQVLSSGDEIGVIRWAGADGTDLESVSASIQVFVDGTPGPDNMPGRLVLSTTLDGASSPTEALRITKDRVVAYNQPDVTSKAAAATLTVAELKTKIIQYTGAAATLTLPTGTLAESGFSGIYTNMTFEWSVINTGSGLCTIGAGTGHTIVGGATVAAGASGRFASRRTATNTFVTYRLS